MNPDPVASRRNRVLAVLALGCIALQFPGRLLPSALALAAWLLGLAWLDRNALSRMGRPRFWAITILLALATGVALGRKDLEVLGVPISSEGLLAGALMVVRGALIFGIAAWAGPALAGRRMPLGLARLGLAPLGGAATVALGLLPALKDRLALAGAPEGEPPRGLRARFGRAQELAVQAFCETVRLAQELAEVTGRAPGHRLVAVVGDPGQGKTSCVSEVARRLREAGLQVGGIVQPAIVQGGRRVGYDLQDLATGERHPIARLREDGRPGTPRFVFEESGWAWAADRIRRARRDTDVLVVDELGRLEAIGAGHLPAIREALPGDRARWWVLAIRRDALPAVTQWVGREWDRVDLSTGPGDRDRAVDRITDRILQAEASSGQEGSP